MTQTLKNVPYKKLVFAAFVSGASSFALSSSAFAQSEKSGLYGTLGITQVSAEIDLGEISASGATAELGQQDAKITMLTGRLGYRLASFIAIEGEAGLGLGGDSIQQAVPVTVAGLGTVTVDTDADLDVNNYGGVFARGILPLGDQFEVFARAGYGYAKAEASAVGTVAALPGFSASATESDSINDFAYGIGAQFNINETHGIRLDYASIGSDFNVISLAYAVNF